MYMHYYSLSQGLKTGMYYLRTRAAAQAIQFTVDQTVIKSASTKSDEMKKEEQEEAMICSLKNKEACISCSA